MKFARRPPFCALAGGEGGGVTGRRTTLPRRGAAENPSDRHQQEHIMASSSNSQTSTWAIAAAHAHWVNQWFGQQRDTSCDVLAALWQSFVVTFQHSILMRERPIPNFPNFITHHRVGASVFSTWSEVFCTCWGFWNFPPFWPEMAAQSRCYDHLWQ